MQRSIRDSLKSTDQALWKEALNTLLMEHTPESCQLIITVLSDKIWYKRQAAFNALIGWGPKIVDIILPILSEENLDELYWLLILLGNMQDPRAIETIKSYLQSQSAEIRSYAVRAISVQKTLENARLLYPMINDPNWSIRKLVFEKLLSFEKIILNDLRKMITSTSASPHHTLIALFTQIGDDASLPEISALYSKGTFALKYTIITALSELATPKALNFIIRTLSDSSWAIRKVSSEQLLKHGNKVLDSLTTYFAKSDSLVRHDIVEILVQILNERSLPLIEKLLASNEYEFLLLAMKNLVKLKNDAATEILLSCLANNDRIISDYAAHCLSLKKNLNVTILLNKLDTGDENLRFQIIKIIASIGGLALTPIVKILESGNKQERLFLLGVLQRIEPSPRLIESLIKLLDDPLWPIRNAATNCLIYYKEVSVPFIVQALNSKSDDTAYWSRKALLGIGRIAVETLKQILQSGESPELIPEIVSALLAMDDPEAIPAVIKFFETNDELKIQNVFEHVPPIKSKDVINSILNLLGHPEEKVVKWLTSLLKTVELPHLKKSVFLGLSHSSDVARYYLYKAISHWRDLSEADLRPLYRQLFVEKNHKNLLVLASTIAFYPFESAVETLKELFYGSDTDLKLDLMVATAETESKPHLEMLNDILSNHPEVLFGNETDEVQDENINKMGIILGHIYKNNPEGLLSGITSPSIRYRQCVYSALYSFENRKVAFAIMENMLQNEESHIVKLVVKILVKYFFHDDFRLKDRITEFFLSLGKIISEPLSQTIETLENEIDKKALVDLVESVGGTVDPNLLLSSKKKKVVLSDSHLDEVLEKRKQALQELEKYDELIKTTHTKELAIMFTDVRGYTAFSAKASLSEVMTMLRQHDEILEPVFLKHNGEIIKKIGDSFLVVFEEDNSAILAAIEIQRQLKNFNLTVPEERKLAIKIAINSGSVIRTEKDVLGDAVNVAARLEGLSKAEEIVISEATYNKISKDIFEVQSYGDHMVKGIEKPIKTFKIIW